MNDDYTMDMRLCDDDGMVSGKEVKDDLGQMKPGASYLDRLNHLRSLSAFARGEEHFERVTESFTCTGHAHLAGEHIRCTSPAHDPQPQPRSPIEWWTTITIPAEGIPDGDYTKDFLKAGTVFRVAPQGVATFIDDVPVESAVVKDEEMTLRGRFWR